MILEKRSLTPGISSLSANDTYCIKHCIRIKTSHFPRHHCYDIRSKGDRIVVTQEDGRILDVALSGEVTEIVNLNEVGLGSPLGIACNQNSLAITTSTGWLVLIDSQRKYLLCVS